MALKESKDAAQRQRAVEHLRSCAVIAPAGSGKTELLSQRMLNLLCHVEQPEEILAITFTRKAAREMQSRIISALRAAATQPEPQQSHQRQTWQLAGRVLAYDRQRNWALLSHPNRLKIQTIDGLSAGLTHQLPIVSGLGGRVSIVDEPQACYRQAVQYLMESLESNDPWSPSLALLLGALDNYFPRLESLLIDLLSKRDQWLPHFQGGVDKDVIGVGNIAARQTEAVKQQLEHAMQQSVKERLSECQCLIGTHLISIWQLCMAASDNLQAENLSSIPGTAINLQQLPSAQIEQVDQWLAIAQLLLTAKGQWRKTLTKRQGFPVGDNKQQKQAIKAYKALHKQLIEQLQAVPGLRQALHRLKHLPGCYLADEQWALLQALSQVLPVLVAQLRVVFQQQGGVDYCEMALSALQALGDEQTPSDLALILDYRIRHILVDEFQDTSTTQLCLLERLTWGWEAGDGRSLFIVGDPMQSCYGFRGANVGLFLSARQYGIGSVSLENIDLQVNFRASETLVNWVNGCFQSAFPAKQDIALGAVPYQASTAFNAAVATDEVACFAYLDQQERSAEAAHLGQLLCQTLAKHPKDNIAILVRNRSHLTEILPALRQAGIAWNASEIDPLIERVAVIDLLSLVRALLYPADRVAWLSLLRTAWCGLSLADLHGIANAGLTKKEPTPVWIAMQNFNSLPELSPTGKQQLARMVAILRQGLQQRQRKSLRIWVESIWLALGGAVTLSTAHERADVHVLLDLLEQFDQGGGISDWSLFQGAVKRLFASANTDADERVQVMTIHKSKGLEFDTVILPGLDRKPRPASKPLLLWQECIFNEGQQGLLMASLSASAKPDPVYNFLLQQRSAQQQLENTRLTYVATTRAKKRLYLLANLKSASDAQQPELQAPDSHSLLATIWQNVQGQFKAVQHKLPTKAANLQENRPLLVQGLMRLDPNWKPPELPYGHSHASAQDHHHEQSHKSKERDTARMIGLAIHRSLRQIVQQGVEGWNAKGLEHWQPIWTTQLLQEGLGLDQLASATQRVSADIIRTLADAKGRWILDNQHRDSLCEHPLSMRVQGETFNYVIDRSFIDPAGVRWIIDYKTAMPAPDITKAAFLQQQKAVYLAQMQNYKQLFQAMESRTTRMALYFTALGFFYELR